MTQKNAVLSLPTKRAAKTHSHPPHRTPRHTHDTTHAGTQPRYSQSRLASRETTTTTKTQRESQAKPTPRAHHRTLPPFPMVSANAPAPDAGAAASGEDASKKVRKPYTITKSRESWTEQEHDKFLEALQLFDRDWKKIEAFVGSKTVIQIRSHAQKYFLKVQKNGTSEHVPPPRPKRKAAHPYPQKASKNGYALKTDSSAMLRNSGMDAAVSSWAHNSILPVVASSMVKEDLGAGTMGPNNFCSSSTEGPTRAWQPGETSDQINQVPSLRRMPDFAQVYSFLGSVFDPSTSGHLQKLKEMNPIDVETALLLMRNLSINLTSSDFEDQRKLLSSYSSTSDGLELGTSRSSLLADRPLSAAFMIKGE